jgi:hypothetical protein
MSTPEYLFWLYGDGNARGKYMLGFIFPWKIGKVKSVEGNKLVVEYGNTLETCDLNGKIITEGVLNSEELEQNLYTIREIGEYIIKRFYLYWILDTINKEKEKYKNQFISLLPSSLESTNWENLIGKKVKIQLRGIESKRSEKLVGIGFKNVICSREIEIPILSKRDYTIIGEISSLAVTQSSVKGYIKDSFQNTYEFTIQPISLANLNMRIGESFREVFNNEKEKQYYYFHAVEIDALGNRNTPAFLCPNRNTSIYWIISEIKPIE